MGRSYRIGEHVYVRSGKYASFEGMVDFVDVVGERVLIDFGEGRKGGLGWVAFGELPNDEPRPAVRSFALVMERVLRANDGKGGWKDCTLAWLLGRLEEEVRELKAAIADPNGSRDAIVYESADVANFAMMIADVAVDLTKWIGRREGRQP